MITPTTSTHALKGICSHNQRHLPPQRRAFVSKTLSKAFARQDPPWHGGFPTFYSMITPHNRVQRVFLFPAQTIVPTSPWPRHECHASPTTLQVSSVEVCSQLCMAKWPCEGGVRRGDQYWASKLSHGSGSRGCCGGSCIGWVTCWKSWIIWQGGCRAFSFLSFLDDGDAT